MEAKEFLQKTALDLLEKLTVEHPAKWGLMSPQHMVEHLGSTFMISNGKTRLPDPPLPPEQLARRREKFFANTAGFPQNVQNPILGDGLQPLRFENLEAAKAKFLAAAAAFWAFWAENPDEKLVHPIFGGLDFWEWQEFHRRHVSHHFAQFGLIEN